MTTRNKSEYEIPTVIDFEFPNCLGLIPNTMKTIRVNE